MMEKSDNRSEECKGMIIFLAAKGRCIGKALYVSQELTLALLLWPDVSLLSDVQQDWAPPNDVKTISDEIEAITDDFDLSGNTSQGIPRTMSTSARTGFEKKSAYEMTRMYTENPD